MGRTLHYQFKPKNGLFTDKELEQLYEVGRIYKERCKWTCESLDITPYDVCPNWDNLPHKNCDEGWDKLTKRWNQLATKGLHPNIIAQELVKCGTALFHRDNPQKGFYGFTKTGGNEFNSLQVVLGVTAATRVVKNAECRIHDEGKLLVCPLVISDGKVQADTSETAEKICWLLGAPLFENGYKQYAKEFKQQAKELWYCIHPKRESGVWYSTDEWFALAKFVRPINAKDFEDYPEYNGAQIMAGFNGEYFGLSDEDPEATSYRMIALLQKALPDDAMLEITPKLKH